MKLRPLLVFGLVGLAFQTLQAQTLDQAERELQAAKEQQARKDAANRAARERAQAEAHRMASLTIRSDADCRLTINGEDAGVLKNNAIRKFKALAGDVLLECVSTEDAAVRFSEVKQFAAQQNAVVLIGLEAEVTAARNQVAAAKSKADAAAAAKVANHKRFVQAGDGALQDLQTGLLWMQSDNGADIDWNGARQFCASRGWSLPSVGELRALHDDSNGTPCGPIVCAVPDHFRLSSYWFWSETSSGAADAWAVSLVGGHQGAFGVDVNTYYRALCVRRS